MLLSKTAITKWNSRNRKHFESKGYIFTSWKNEFEFEIKDSLPTGKYIVKVQCDYCFNIIEKMHCDYLIQRKIIQKDCCSKCRSIKLKETYKLIYGIDHPAKNEMVKEKRKQTILERYGCENISQNEEIKEKRKNNNLKKYGFEFYFQTEEFKEKNKLIILEKYGKEYYVQTDDFREKYRNICQEKYGCDNTFQVEEFKDKSRETCLEKYGTKHYVNTEEYIISTINTNIKKYGVPWVNQNKDIRLKIENTNYDRYGFSNPMKNEAIKSKSREAMYKNGTCACSKQQLYIFKLIGGELNYPIDGCNLDIAFLNEMIYFEYDGGGHDLCVKLDHMAEDEFIKRNRKRWYFLNKNGWKEIKIISLTDKLPNDDKIIEMINYAKDYINTNHSWIHFNIDKGIVKCSQFENEYNYGELRRIYKEDGNQPIIDPNII